MFLDIAPQGIVQVNIRLNAVDAIDFGNVITRQLVAATGTQFEDRAMGFRDEFWDTSYSIDGRNCRVWRLLEITWQHFEDSCMVSRPYQLSATICQRHDHAICLDRGHLSAETGRSQSPAKQESRLLLKVSACWDTESGVHTIETDGEE